jgi:hypothetical protein
MTVQIEVQYQARPGSGFSDKDAAVIGPELERILDQSGNLEARTIMHAASVASSPLHKYIFNLPPDKAAEKYYLLRAGRVARSILITMPTKKGEALVRAFYSVAMNEADENDREYMPVRDVLSEPDLLRRQLFRFRRDIERVKGDYALFRQVA